jgi:SAM-dependent methyltransferase
LLHPEECRLQISDEAFSYLSVQAGAISDLAGSRGRWEAAYEAQLYETYKSIVPFLPKHVGRVLDIGSGLGGIDVLLNRHYGGGVEVSAIDGIDEPPVSIEHDRPFSSERVTRKFLNGNKVDAIAYFAPTMLPAPRKYPLIISFAAWCFHIPPGVYLGFVVQCLRLGGILIADVRKRDDYFEQLSESLTVIGCAVEGTKFKRMVYAAR